MLLRRTLDYQFPNQRAQVFVSAAGISPPKWRTAGVWYLAGGNTCLYSNPRDELGAAQVRLQTSNRRYRDDEFLIPRALTEGRSQVRIRLQLTPVSVPLVPDGPVPDLAWSEIKHTAYCYKVPDFQPKP